MQESKAQQLFFMQWAIRLGEKGRITAPPNPWVGCVIVKDGEILGQGYHIGPGHPHAEITALNQAGRNAKEATAYISLEPCAHQGRTPPCTEALIKAGIKKIVVPFLDPDSHVSGKGIERLKAAGIEIVVGIGAEEAKESLEPYLHHRKHCLPFCVLKSAISIDGKIAAEDGSSKWITCDDARRDAHLLRARSQAILIGPGTARHDLPSLTVREIEVDKQPLRVLIDPKGEVEAKGPLFDTSLAPTLVFTNKKISGIETEPFVDLLTLLKNLGERGIIQLLIEGGAGIHTAFLREKLAQQCVVYLGNCLLGESGLGFHHLQVHSIENAPRWELKNLSRFGSSVRLDYSLS